MSFVLDNSPGHDKVVPVTHSPDSLHNIALVVLNDLDPFQALWDVSVRLSRRPKGQLTMPMEKHHLAMYAEFV